MSSYSVDGYVSALAFRTSKSVLVEGPTDRRCVSRVRAELERRGIVPFGAVVVDSANLIRGEGRAIGNRALVELIFAQAVAAGFSLAALVDREFRDFEVGERVIDRLKGHFESGNLLVWTRGHSLENYFLDEGTAKAFLLFQFSDELNGGCFEVIHRNIAAIIQWIAAVSAGLHLVGLTERASGIASIKHWHITDGVIELSPAELVSDLQARGATPEMCAGLKAQLSSVFAVLSDDDDPEVGRWLAHGHIGFELFWSAIAVCCTGFASDSVLDAIAKGYAATKLSVAADRWAIGVVEQSVESPRSLWKWFANEHKAA